MSARRTRKNGVDSGNAVHLANLRIINGCIVLDVCSGKFHRVSETAAFVIGELQRQTAIAGIIAAYSRRYATSPAIAARDIELFLNDMSVTR
jgi:hypothetical protein